MRLNGLEWFALTDGLRETRYRRVEDMTQFEVLCAANHCQRNGHADMAAALFAWQAKMRHNPRRTPPDAA